MPASRSRPGRVFERFSPARLTVLRQLGKRPHRYRTYRFLTMLLSVLLLFAVPLLGVARFDLFRGEHLALGERVAPLYGLTAVSVAIFAFYFVTFQVNLFAGRMFCGFGCPVGQLNRLTDTLRAVRDPKQRMFWAVMLGGFVLSSGAAVLLWWTSPALFTTWPGALVGFGAIALFAGSALAFGRFWGWSFCMKACPIGLYYSVVQQKKPLGILFEEEKCLQEGACVKACPVLLDPRDLVQLRTDIGGFAVESLPANNHCLRCGACVEACDLVTSKHGPVALAFGRPERPIEIMWRSPERLVQLPSAHASASAVLPAQRFGSEDEEDIEPPMLTALPEPERPIDWRAVLLTGGDRGIWGTGLSLLWLLGAIAVSGAVFVYWGGPLWTVARATSVTERLLVSSVVCPAVVAVALLAHRRMTLGRWSNASGIALSGAWSLVTALFMALSPGSAFSYKPRDTWEEPAAAVAVKRVPPYAAATGVFAAGTIEGKVTVDGAPAAGVAVLVQHPRPGLPLEGSVDHHVDFGARGYARPLYVVRASDRLLLSNETDKFHTFVLSRNGRGERNLPLPPKLSVKLLAAPAPGEYEVSCGNHAGERARLVVLDHGYVTTTADDGSFQLARVPAGDVTLVALGVGLRAEQKLVLTPDRATRGDFSISRSNPENAKEE